MKDMSHDLILRCKDEDLSKWYSQEGSRANDWKVRI